MPRDAITPLPQPVFDEGSVTPDPTRFSTAHPSDSQLYKVIQKLLTKDVVSFSPSRVPPDGMFALRDAWGPHGPESSRTFNRRERLFFMGLGIPAPRTKGNMPMKCGFAIN